MARRGTVKNLRPFKKGQSGNPGGMRKQDKHVRELARERTAEAITALVECLADASGSVRVAAAEALLSRGWGRPTVGTPGESGEQISRQVVEFANDWRRGLDEPSCDQSD